MSFVDQLAFFLGQGAHENGVSHADQYTTFPIIFLEFELNMMKWMLPFSVCPVCFHPLIDLCLLFLREQELDRLKKPGKRCKSAWGKRAIF
jgi:hypothetical protein